MKLSLIAPATATLVISGNEVKLKGAKNSELEPLISAHGTKFTDFLRTPLRYPEIGLAFFLACFVGEDTDEEATAFYQSLVAGHENRLLNKCIELTFPPFDDGEAQLPSGSSTAPDEKAVEGAPGHGGTWVKTSLTRSELLSAEEDSA